MPRESTEPPDTDPSATEAPPPRGLGARWRDFWSDPAHTGLVGALLVYFALGLAIVVFLPRFYAPDEPRNVAYGFELWSGRLPEIPDPLPHAEMHTQPLKRSDFHASAQHPPLYYGLVGAPLKVSAWTGDITPGVKIARILTLLLGAFAVIYVFRLVRLLLPRLPAVAVAATGVFVSIPQVPATFGIVYNDALGLLTTLALLHASLEVLKHGPSRSRLRKAALWMALAALTRFAGVLGALIGMGAIFLSAFTHGPSGWLPRIRTGVLRVLPLAAVVLLTSGWFYARSYILYGDVTGAKILFDILDRPYRGSVLSFVFDPEIWVDLYDQLWRNLHGGTRFDDVSVTIARIALVAGVVGAVTAAVHLGRAIRAGRLPRLGRVHALGLVVLLVVFLGATIPPIAFHSKGGSLMVRYCLSTMWIVCAMIGFGFAAVRSALPTQVLLVLLPMFALQTFELYAIDVEKGITGTEFGIVVASAERGMVLPQAFFALVVAVVTLGIVLMVRSVGALHRRVDEPGTAISATATEQPAQVPG